MVNILILAACIVTLAGAMYHIGTGKRNKSMIISTAILTLVIIVQLVKLS